MSEEKALIRKVGPGPAAHHSSINDALEYMAAHRPSWSAGTPKATIRLLSGFVMKEEVHLRNGVDFGWVTLTSEDDRVRIDSGSMTTSVVDLGKNEFAAFLAVRNSTLPIINVLFDFGDPRDDAAAISTYRPSNRKKSAFVVLDNSRLTFRAVRLEPDEHVHAGCLRVDGYALYAGHVADVDAYKTRFDNSYIGYRVANHSRIYARNGTASNCYLGVDIGKGGEFYGNEMYIDGASTNGLTIDGGIAWLSEAKIRGSNDHGIYAKCGALVTAPDATISNSGACGILAETGSSVHLCRSAAAEKPEFGVISRCGSHGVFADTGAMVTLPGAKVNHCKGNALHATTGARISAVNATITEIEGQYDAYVDGASVVHISNGRTNIPVNAPQPQGLIQASVIAP